MISQVKGLEQCLAVVGGQATEELMLFKLYWMSMDHLLNGARAGLSLELNLKADTVLIPLYNSWPRL